MARRAWGLAFFLLRWEKNDSIKKILFFAGKCVSRCGLMHLHAVNKRGVVSSTQKRTARAVPLMQISSAD
jgi:hypothetical protein